MSAFIGSLLRNKKYSNLRSSMCLTMVNIHFQQRVTSLFGKRTPVCFFSQNCNIHQRHYSIFKKEASVMIWALQHFDVYVGGSSEVLMYSDHNPDIFAFIASPNQHLMWWVIFLQPYNLNNLNISEGLITLITRVMVDFYAVKFSFALYHFTP